MSQLKGLVRIFENAYDGVLVEVTKFENDVAAALVIELAFTTPVDTSQALSNWRVSVRGRVLGKRDAHFEGEDGSTRGVSARRTVQNAIRALKARKPGSKVVVSNALPYIQRLNEGWSQQEPAGFIERATAVALRKRPRRGNKWLK